MQSDTVNWVMLTDAYTEIAAYFDSIKPEKAYCLSLNFLQQRGAILLEQTDENPRVCRRRDSV